MRSDAVAGVPLAANRHRGAASATVHPGDGDTLAGGGDPTLVLSSARWHCSAEHRPPCVRAEGEAECAERAPQHQRHAKPSQTVERELLLELDIRTAQNATVPNGPRVRYAKRGRDEPRAA